jgi:hypothetical protein
MGKFGSNIKRKNSAVFLRDPLAASRNNAPRLRDDAEKCKVTVFFATTKAFLLKRGKNETIYIHDN